MKEVDMEFAEFVKKVRKQKGLTQCQLAKLLGVNQATICGIENGRYNAGGAVRRTVQELFSNPSATNANLVKAEFCSASEYVLMDELRAAREELGQPMLEIELRAWEKAGSQELLAESILLREALELRASRELLAGAQAFRKKREAASHGK